MFSLKTLLMIVLSLFSMCTHAWAQCSVTHPQRVELGGGSQQASALETAQASQVYLAYFRHMVSQGRMNNKICDQSFQLSYGLSATYAQAHENSLVWSVIHNEINLNLALENAWRSGLGTFGLKTALGAIWLLESQERLQASRLKSDMLSNDVANASSQFTLSRQAQQVLPLFRISPFTRLKALESSWGELGLSTELNLDYRLLNQNIPSSVTPWAWGIRLGLYITFGLQPTGSTKPKTTEQSDIMKEKKR